MISYSQNAEDVVLNRFFKDRKTGFYVDVGANDPLVFSITRHFYEKGWRGINIDASSEWVVKLNRERSEDINLQVCCGPSEGTVDFFEFSDTGISTCDPENASSGEAATGEKPSVKTVPMRPLSAILEDHEVDEIDFLSIDVEGFEESVLKGLDLSQHRPTVILLEATKPLSTERSDAGYKAYLETRGYQHALFDGLNSFFISDEAKEKFSILAYPVCIFDDFQTITEVNLRGEIVQLEEREEVAKAGRRRAEIELRLIKRNIFWRMISFCKRVGRRVVGKLRGTSKPSAGESE
ncbi:MAG: FkbM family methyltransferase [Verrucomicrobiota bacterium]